ncbi:DNA polymerase III subunit alpha [Pseudoclavibacter sp. CFCC 11306]|uniref:DNA polymerase III subunit alpha n=1 Tax=Pseudoclavibacter sp. CFCC 11306 TaxID=1564493 RepID=UPI001CE4AA4B|nr:DNA polymerase III subunit alpha [Pseudoclavibacter sp. CFCC 11306]
MAASSSTASDSFVHLHVHSEYSMLDGAAKIKPLIAEAARLEMPALAITDHGNMFGTYEFYYACQDAGIKPIIGLEAYLTPGTKRQDRSRVRWGSGGEDDVSGGGSYTHATMLAETTEGMHNLFRLASLSSIEGFYFKPRMDLELLQQYAKGIIATTGCASGEIQTRLRLGQYKEAREAAARYRDIFGPDNYYCEIMDHGIDIERRVMSDLIDLAKDLQLPLVASNDLHYTHAEDAHAHAALLCVQSASTLDDPKRFRFGSDEFYLKTPKQMRELFRDYPGACDNTLSIAERCEVEFVKRDLTPKFDVPEGETELTWFKSEVETGLHSRYGETVPEPVRERANYEMGIIEQMGFPGYFLVVADFIQWAKGNGVRVGPGRGSAAGSMVAYAMHITEVDPLEHGLMFERFLNPERVSMPDVDVDFDDRRRTDVIKYVTEKYGYDRVCQIVTYGSIKAKQALKDSSRILGLPYSAGEKLTKAFPPAVMGKEMTLEEMYDPDAKRYQEGAEFREVVEGDEVSQKILETARGIEGLKRQWGVHAAGVIMSQEALIDNIPIMKREEDGAIITQYPYPACENLGLLKMDFLGLRNLTVMGDAVDSIKQNRGETLNLQEVSLDDKPTYDLLSRGDTLGVFQLDGGPMRTLLKQMKPDSFADISAVIALYRPGPMGMNSHTNYALRKNGLQPIQPIHSELEEPLKDILGETYGLIVYQEQVMGVAQKVAGFTLGQADMLRRAMGKKKKSELDKQYANFHQGMVDRGYSEEAVKALWDTLLPFAGYAFNKAHSVGYGVVSYWTAFLKANYPAEYMSALLTSVGDSKDKLAMYLNECRHMGISVLPPDVNSSFLGFSAVGTDIRFGLGAVRNVGANVVDAIVKTRETEDPFTSFHDFLRKVPLTVCNKRTIESLIKAGAFDSLGSTRRALIEIHEQAVDEAAKLKRNEAHGQVDLFAGMFDLDEQPGAEVPDRPEWDKHIKLSFEREMLGLYVSDHPLHGLERELSRHADANIVDITGGERFHDGDKVAIAGLITSVQKRIARNSGNEYAIIEVEDFTGEMSALFMGKTFQEFSPALVADSIVVVRGRINERDDGATLHAYSVFTPEIKGAGGAGLPLMLSIPELTATPEIVEDLSSILVRHSGDTEVLLKLMTAGAERVFEIPYRVSVTAALYSELKALLGASCID